MSSVNVNRSICMWASKRMVQVDWPKNLSRGRLHDIFMSLDRLKVFNSDVRILSK